MNVMKYCKEFGIKTFLVAGMSQVIRKLFGSNLVSKYEPIKYNYLIKWLDKKYGESSNLDINEDVERNKIEPNCPIWIFWWQGEQSMPPVVKTCYRSVQKNCKQHRVVLITQDNIKEYISISDIIYKKLEEGLFSLTHFSDIVRENLLWQKGGIWMDATILMTAPFDDELYQYEYYTKKGPFKYWNWTGFFQASGKGNIFPKIVSRLFELYWTDHSELITYLLIDCSLSVACKRNEYSRNLIEQLPASDNSIFHMSNKFLDEEFDSSTYHLLCEKTNMHKLSYKYHHEELIDGKQTFWGKIVDGSIVDA